MASKTEKLQQEIERLKAENQSLFESLQRANKQFDDWREQTDVDPADYMQLKWKCDALKFENSTLKHKCERLEKDVAYWKAFNLERPHNERNAGRKSKLSPEQIKEARTLRLQGKSYRRIADKLGCSPSTVLKYVQKLNDEQN